MTSTEKSLSKKTIPPLKLTKSNKVSIGETSLSDSDNDIWQTVEPNNKRIRSPNVVSPLSKKSDSNIFISPNRFSPIAPIIEDDPMGNTNENENIPEKNQSPKPPPIFIQTQLNFNNFYLKIKQLTGSSGFECKSSTKGLKLQTYSSDSYRTVINYLKENNASFHSYQFKELKAFRVVIRNLHPTIDVSFIKEELLNSGFSTRNIMPVTHKSTKTPLPIFFVDLEPGPTNADIFKITSLCFTKVKIKPAHPKKDIPQCHRCQAYGHTRSYCNHAPRCVRCGLDHESVECTKDRSSPAKCALCHGSHPASYKGCKTHIDLKKKLSQSKNITWNNKNHDPKTSRVNNQDLPQPTYSQNFPPLNNEAPLPHSQTNNINPNQDLTTQLSSFINDLKALINPLVSLLTTVIEKLIKNVN